MRLKINKVELKKVKDSIAAVVFDLSWEEAWRNDINCDGVWIFAKYRAKDGLWRHIGLSDYSRDKFDYRDQTPPGFSKGQGPLSSQVGMWVPSERKGVFIYRIKEEGDVSLKQVMLLWNFKETGLQTEDMNSISIKVFGVEMVYIPESEHYVGDPLGPGGPKNCLFTYPDKGAYLVNSEAPITVDAKDGFLYCNQDNERSRDDTPFVIPEEYPKGYGAFWHMKYQLSSQQYVDFLNTLTRRQQQTHVRSDISRDYIENYYVMTGTNTEKFRQSIVCVRKGNGIDTPVTFYTYAPARACNAIAWGDIAAYAAWAGLRPITEFEFEKSCRGPKEAIAWECAWGSNEIGRVETFSGPDGSGYEIKVPTAGLVNACFGCGIAPFDAAKGKTIPDNPGFEGPVSCGLFSNTRHEGIPKRLNDGASYYGVMELSGNLWESCVTFGHPKGRAFIPNHGEGVLDEDGCARIPGWPGESGIGSGARGGVYRSPDATYLAVALRFAGAHSKSEPRYNGGLRVGF